MGKRLGAAAAQGDGKAPPSARRVSRASCLFRTGRAPSQRAEPPPAADNNFRARLKFAVDRAGFAQQCMEYLYAALPMRVVPSKSHDDLSKDRCSTT